MMESFLAALVLVLLYAVFRGHSITVGLHIAPSGGKRSENEQTQLAGRKPLTPGHSVTVQRVGPRN